MAHILLAQIIASILCFHHSSISFPLSQVQLFVAFLHLNQALRSDNCCSLTGFSESSFWIGNIRTYEVIVTRYSKLMCKPKILSCKWCSVIKNVMASLLLFFIHLCYCQIIKHIHGRKYLQLLPFCSKTHSHSNYNDSVMNSYISQAWFTL